MSKLIDSLNILLSFFNQLLVVFQWSVAGKKKCQGEWRQIFQEVLRVGDDMKLVNEKNENKAREEVRVIESGKW